MVHSSRWWVSVWGCRTPLHDLLFYGVPLHDRSRGRLMVDLGRFPHWHHLQRPFSSFGVSTREGISIRLVAKNKTKQNNIRHIKPWSSNVFEFWFLNVKVSSGRLFVHHCLSYYVQSERRRRDIKSLDIRMFIKVKWTGRPRTNPMQLTSVTVKAETLVTTLQPSILLLC